MNDSKQADVIKIAAVLTAAPRWAGALMAADGVPVPDGWIIAWRYAALGLSLGMAAAEGFAISFVFNAWRNQHDKRSRWLLFLAILMLVDFGVILAPYIVANVSGETLSSVLGTEWLIWLWSGAVAASTGLVVGSVGYAQKESKAKPATSQPKAAKAGYTCDSCDELFASQSALNAHSPARCADKLAQNGKEPATEIIERSA
jgi:hypothetical protein